MSLGSDQIDRLSKLTDIYELENNAASRPLDLILGINMIRIPEMYYIMAEVLLEEDANLSLTYYNEVRQHRGLEPFEGPLTLKHINEERYKEYIGEGQLWFNMKRQNLSIKSSDNVTTFEGGKAIYAVPIPDIEIENRF